MKFKFLDRLGVKQILEMIAFGGADGSDGLPTGRISIIDIGAISQSRNRNRVSVTSTREKVTWNLSDNIREIKIIAKSTNTVAPNGSEALGACFNAGTDAIADAWLTEGDSETTDVQYELVSVDDGEFVFRFTSPVTRMDMKLLAGSDTAFRVFVGAH